LSLKSSNFLFLLKTKRRKHYSTTAVIYFLNIFQNLINLSYNFVVDFHGMVLHNPVKPVTLRLEVKE